MIKYEVIDTGVRILDIGSIKRGCGLIFESKIGSILSGNCPDIVCNFILVHGENKSMDNNLLRYYSHDDPNWYYHSNPNSWITDLLDEYNKEIP